MHGSNKIAKILTGAALLLGLLVSNRTHAWCQANTCDRQNPPPGCVKPAMNECIVQGQPLRWPTTCVSTSVSAKGSPKLGITADQLRQVVEDAFEQWTTVDCGGGAVPNFVVDIFPDVNCTDVYGDKRYNSRGPNYNLWSFRDEDWDTDATADGTLALTRTTYDAITGMIYDTDVELDSKDRDFTMDLTNVVTDLASVVQHESGHFLGLGHSSVDTATMYFQVKDGTTSLRSLDQDDIDGVCAIHPPGDPDPNCNPEPRHGFSTECSFAPDSGCSIAPGHAARYRSSVLLLSSLLVAFAAQRKERTRKALPRLNA